MDKVREEFEAWFMKEKADKIQDDIQFLTKEIMYEGWKASRESIIVQLPEHCKGNALTVSELKEQLDKEGIKYDF